MESLLPSVAANAAATANSGTTQAAIQWFIAISSVQLLRIASPDATSNALHARGGRVKYGGGEGDSNGQEARPRIGHGSRHRPARFSQRHGGGCRGIFGRARGSSTGVAARTPGPARLLSAT